MCYINGQRVTWDEYKEYKKFQAALRRMKDAIDDTWNLRDGFTYGPGIVAVPGDDGELQVKIMEWGFVPDPKSWPFITNREKLDKIRKGYKDATGKYHPSMGFQNAKGEELLQLGKVYRDAALHRRCLILSSGFYEWRHLPKIGKKGEPLKATDKIPYHIYLKECPMFPIAGIWQPWTDQETGETIDTFSLVTTDANPIMRQIHNSKNRMPTILTDSLADEWLQPDLSEERILEIATSQFPAELMAAHTIRKDFKETADPLETFVYENVPELVYD